MQRSRVTRARATKESSSSSQMKTPVEELDPDDNGLSESEGETDSDYESKERSKIGGRDKQIIPSIDARKIFLCHTGIDKSDWNDLITISLPHPGYGEDALFAINALPESGKGLKPFLYETIAMTSEQEYSCWFTDNIVTSDGNLYILTPVDPLFMILPAVSKSVLAKPIFDHLIELYPLTFTKSLVRRVTEKQLENIAVQKVSGDTVAYVYNDERAISWLCKKVRRVAKYFAIKKFKVTEATTSSIFTRVPAKERKGTEKEDYLRYACDVVSMYLDITIIEKVERALGLPPESLKRKISEESPDSKMKRPKLGDESLDQIKPTEDYGTPNGNLKSIPKRTTSTTQKKLQQAAKGKVKIPLWERVPAFGNIIKSDTEGFCAYLLMGCEQSTFRKEVLHNVISQNGKTPGNQQRLTIEPSKDVPDLSKSEPIEDINLEDPEVQEAAERIQAAYRGHRIRKDLKMAKQEEEVVDIDLGDPDVALAATRIQASFRGHQAKRAAVKAEAELSKKLEELKADEEEEELPDLSDPELNKAATKIQAQFRGHMVRKDEKGTTKPSK